MKIKIHTYFYGNNYGALLQSLCLKTYLIKQFKANVEFNRYQPKKFIYREEFKPLIKKNLYHSFLGFKKFFKLRHWKNKFIVSKPSIKFKKIIAEKNNLSFYGSDEIWNFNNPFFGFDKFFFGDKNENLKFSYAASLGNGASIKEINPDLILRLKSYFDQFKLISVRDKSSYDFLKDKFNIEASIVLDPVFLIDNIFEIVNLKNEDKNVFNDYCLIYGQYFSLKDIQIIKDFSKTKNLKIISIGYYNKWADKNFIDATPSEFLLYLKNSKYVFTSMFHGVLLSIKLNKDFWFTEDPYRKNKLDYVLDLLNLRNRTLKREFFHDEKINYVRLNSVIENHKQTSKKFLEKCINFKIENDYKY